MRVGRVAITQRHDASDNKHRSPTAVVPLSHEEQKDLVTRNSNKLSSGLATAALGSNTWVGGNDGGDVSKTATGNILGRGVEALTGVSKVALDGTGNILGKSVEVLGGMSKVARNTLLHPGLTNMVGAVQSEAEEVLRAELEEQMEKVRVAADATNPAKIWRKLLSDVDEKMQESDEIDTSGLAGWELRYMTLAKVCRGILDTSQWTVFIFFCILIAGLMVGLLTYPGTSSIPFVQGVENFVLSAFILEILMKMIAEGWTPWCFFTNHEWKWNWLDFVVVVFSLPIPGGQEQLKMFRLLRLLRFSRMVNEVPNLKLIISGLISSLNFVSYIVLLWFMIIYIYALLGIEMFGENDPFHFRSVEIAVVTLFQVTVMDMWAEIMYVNYYGCEAYPSVYYTSDPALVEGDGRKIGQLMLCEHPVVAPALTSSYFLSYLFITGFCIVPLFTASVFVSMADCVQEMEENRVVEHRKRSLVKLEVKKADMKKNQRRLDHKTKITLQLLSLAFQGHDITERVNANGDLIDNKWQLWYVGISERVKEFIDSPLMRELMMEVLVASGVIVGLYTNSEFVAAHGQELYVCNWVLQAFFVAEVMLKIVGEGLYPQMYFSSGWNTYDFVITVCTMIPETGSFATVLRLFRLFRLIRLAKELRQLQVIVAGGIKGLNSATYILAILFLTYYIYAIIANSLLAKNDVPTFGMLHRSMGVLAQISTLDNWSTYIYTSLYGCEHQPSPLQFSDDECQDSHGQYLVTVIFFFSFTIFGSYILLSLFIGAIYIGMETENNAQEVLLHVAEEVKEICRQNKLGPAALARYETVFRFLDITDSERLLKEELMFGMEAGTSSTLDRDEFEDLWNVIDADGGGDIDFAEFLMFMTHLRKLHKNVKAEEAAAALLQVGTDPREPSPPPISSRSPTVVGAALLRRTVMFSRAQSFSRGGSELSQLSAISSKSPSTKDSSGALLIEDNEEEEEEEEDDDDDDEKDDGVVFAPSQIVREAARVQHPSAHDASTGVLVPHPPKRPKEDLVAGGGLTGAQARALREAEKLDAEVEAMKKAARDDVLLKKASSALGPKAFGGSTKRIG